MKANTVTIFGRKITFGILMLSALAFLAVSCEKEESFMMADGRTTGSGMVEAELKTAGSAPAPGDASIAAIAIDAGFEELVGALAYVDEKLNAGLVNLFLNGKDQFTVFAPTNEAFEGLYGALGVDGITDLPAELVLDVLFYHVAEGRRAANSVVPRARWRTITTLLGETFTVNTAGVITDIAGQSVNIVAADISASNGIIHVIDAVLLPIKNNGSKSAMNGARGQAVAANPASSAAPAPGDASIAAIAIDAGFEELVGALAYVDEKLNAGLVNLFLNGKDQFTVFAPTNEAFEGLYKALEVDGITDLPAELVLDVLFYHVVEGRRAANSVVPRARTRNITTLLGETFTVNSSGVITDIAGQSVNIVAADISASNGIIHVIDTVLLPLQ
jgi:uncharacterized surface protein with fasciclin (FAS1) repeats